jgi:cytochrome c553
MDVTSFRTFTSLAGVALCVLSSMTVTSASLATGTSRGDKAFGEYLSSECVTCHQISGKAVGAIPPIVGWPEDQFLAVMAAYKNKERENNVMQTIAAKLKDDELAALATYFGSINAQNTK